MKDDFAVKKLMFLPFILICYCNNLQGSISPNFFAEQKDTSAQHLVQNLTFNFTINLFPNCLAKVAKFMS
jgi:hypothetical protein